MWMHPLKVVSSYRISEQRKSSIFVFLPLFLWRSVFFCLDFFAILWSNDIITSPFDINAKVTFTIDATLPRLVLEPYNYRIKCARHVGEGDNEQ